MARGKRKRRKAKLVPPKGPALNLRPAGAHKNKKRYDRKRDKDEAVKEADE